MNEPIPKVLGQRLSLIETTLDLAEEALEHELVALATFWSEQAHKDLDAFVSTMNESLGDLTEWQVSAFHDQYTVLQNRNSKTLLALITTKEN